MLYRKKFNTLKDKFLKLQIDDRQFIVLRVYDKFRSNKNTYKSTVCPNSHINTQCSHLWRQHNRVLRMQSDIKVPNVILRYIVPSVLHLFSHYGNGCGRLWRKSKIPLHRAPYVFNRRDIWGSYWPAVCGRAVSSWKSTSPSCRRNGSRTGLTTCAM